MYEKNAMMNQVIKLLTLYLGVDRNFLMTEYNFEELKLILLIEFIIQHFLIKFLILNSFKTRFKNLKYTVNILV